MNRANLLPAAGGRHVMLDPTVTVLGLAAIVLLTGVSAFLSSSELAVLSVARHRIDALVAAGTPGARRSRGSGEPPTGFPSPRS
jgi:CBS domain containing-hemolysin-like protein